MTKKLNAKSFINKRFMGTTLVEVMVAIVILSVGMLGFIGAFGGIATAIHKSRGKTVATNLAQEQIESLKNLSYYRLLVTVSHSTATESGVGGFYYDDTYYPSEKLVVGDKEYIRRVYVQKVTESGGNLIANNWWEEDTGLKLITSYVLWQEGNEWQKFEATNLRDNVNRQPMDSTFTGAVESGVTPLEDAKVLLLQNLLLKDVTNASGDYAISVPAGTYTLKASKKGYFSSTIESTVNSGDTNTVDFDLVEKGSGTISGIAYINDHLVISQVVGSIDDGGFCQEYVEIYNPSTYTWTIASDPVTPVIDLKYQHRLSALSSAIPMSVYNTLTIGPSSYYLFANTTTVVAATVSKAADAVFPVSNYLRTTSGGPCADGTNDADGVGLAWNASGDWIDRAGWGTGTNTPPLLEGSEIPQTTGLEYDEQYIRNSAPTIYNPGDGNGYDTNDNSDDFSIMTPITVAPRNSSDSEEPLTGTPAESGLVFVDDGLSSSTEVDEDGAFLVLSVATGAWTVTISSGASYHEELSVTVTDTNNTNLGVVQLGSTTTGGFAVGKVVDSGNNPLNNIEISASGDADTTDSNGNFRLSLIVGTFTVTVNPNNANSDYTTAEATNVVVNLGEQTAIPDITLFKGGKLNGWVTTNGTDPLPGIPIVAISSGSGAEVGSYVTDSQGYFYFNNLSVGDYSLIPQLEVGESASPSTLDDTVVGGATVFVGTFTISNAFAMISGTVSDSGESIDTGVLLLAVPASQDPLTSPWDPPTNNSALRSGSTYYYIGSSDSEGNYTLSVRGETTYNVHAWYTTFSGGTPSTSHKSGSVSVSAGGNGSVLFTWP